MRAPSALLLRRQSGDFLAVYFDSVPPVHECHLFQSAVPAGRRNSAGNPYVFKCSSRRSHPFPIPLVRFPSQNILSSGRSMPRLRSEALCLEKSENSQLPAASLDALCHPALSDFYRGWNLSADSEKMIHSRLSTIDQFGLSCARVEEVSLDERLNAARQVRYKIYKNALVPCQGLVLGYVIAKRPPLSDFALSPTRIFKIDKALDLCTRYKTGVRVT